MVDNDEANIDIDALITSMNEQLSTTAATVRNAVLTVATERARGNTFSGGNGADLWIPALSQLAGYILDAIGIIAIAMDSTMKQQQTTSKSHWTTKVYISKKYIYQNNLENGSTSSSCG